MSATIRVGQDEATVTEGVWTSNDNEFAALCTEIAAIENELRSPAYKPDTDYAAAQWVASALKGAVIMHRPPPHDFKVVY